MRLSRMLLWLWLLVALVVGYLMFEGQGIGPISAWYSGNPHMKFQEHIRAYEAKMPAEPTGAVPLESDFVPLPDASQAKEISNPLAARHLPTMDDCVRGQTYYDYYCLMCHGEHGDGNGPVGQSYLPRPPDLRSAKIQAYSDGELLRAMLLGDGHQPVLEHTVRPQHRWYLVAYLRWMSQQADEDQVAP